MDAPIARNVWVSCITLGNAGRQLRDKTSIAWNTMDNFDNLIDDLFYASVAGDDFL